ncbi:MAG: Trm112 family protein [Marinomonas sp.]
MNKVLLDILVCPVTKAPLTLNKEGTELISKVGGMAYPVRDGIPVLLETEARTLSAEERLDSGSSK